jgi:amino acid permease
MSNVLQSDVFFFISSISVVFITVAILIALVYVIGILREVKGFFSSIKRGTDTLAEDLSQIRVKLSDKGIWTGFLLSLITAVTGFTQRSKAKRTSRKKNEDAE